jgi:ubiquinone/menaquinone biosynthesis C-methylase UbiE
MQDRGWEFSADAWIASQGDHGDWSRQFVLDPVMKERVARLQPKNVLDVGCGEGRFCRVMKEIGVEVAGIDPTERLLKSARDKDPSGDYREAYAEAIPFADGTFDLVVSYLSLIDIPDHRVAIREMARVLRPGGRLLIANMTNFASTSAQGWVKDKEGKRLYFPVDNYLGEYAMWVSWKGIHIENWHRPLSSYFDALLHYGLQLEEFLEPPAQGCSEEEIQEYARAPWFLVMQWRKP